MNKQSHIHKKADSSASNPVRSQLQSRPFIAQAKAQPQKPLTQTQTENLEFQQQKFEATKLELQAKYGTITPEGQEQLTVLQAKMSGSLHSRLQQASSNGSNFANIPISRPHALSQPVVQTKLKIGEPGDKFEKDADQFAKELDQLIHAPVSRQAEQNLQPKEISIAEKEIQTKPMLQLRAAVGGMTNTAGLETAINQARGNGQPLADNVRKPMEQFSGTDMSRVKVHTDQKADQLSRSIQARAFTTGQDIFFAKGEYNPSSREGKKLIFHEGRHVAQQNGNKVQGHQQQTDKVSKKLGIIQRMNVAAQQHNGVAAFLNNHQGYNQLVQNITQDMSDQQILNQLLDNFGDRQDFNYTGTYSSGWNHRGDCHTLVNEFIETAGFFNIQINHRSQDGPLFIPGGGRIIHNQQRTGNVDNGSHWRFDNHHTAEWNGTTIDVLFGRMQAMHAVRFQEGREAEFTIGGTTYYVANNATTNESNTFTSNTNNRMDFSSQQPPRREIKTKFCCCTIM